MSSDILQMGPERVQASICRTHSGRSRYVERAACRQKPHQYRDAARFVREFPPKQTMASFQIVAIDILDTPNAPSFQIQTNVGSHPQFVSTRATRIALIVQPGGIV